MSVKYFMVIEYRKKSGSPSSNTTSQTTTVAPFLAWRG
jgi:hypothetical protein